MIERVLSKRISVTEYPEMELLLIPLSFASASPARRLQDPSPHPQRRARARPVPGTCPARARRTALNPRRVRRDTPGSTRGMGLAGISAIPYGGPERLMRSRQNRRGLGMLKKAQLWFYAYFYAGALIVTSSFWRRVRMSHNNGTTATGRIKIVDNPTFPEHDFLQAGREFKCRLRHASVSYDDDTVIQVRAASLKFDDSRW